MKQGDKKKVRERVWQRQRRLIHNDKTDRIGIRKTERKLKREIAIKEREQTKTECDRHTLIDTQWLEERAR